MTRCERSSGWASRPSARLLDMPRLALARRFRGAEDVVDALDRALGRKPEPLTAAPTEPPPRAALRAGRTGDASGSGEPGARAADPGSRPAAGGTPSRRAAAGADRLSASTAALPRHRSRPRFPAASRSISQRLLADKAAALDPEFGFDAFALTADWTEDLGAAQESLVEEPSGERELARLVDRLTVKLGPRAVRRPQPQESHLPERASGWVSCPRQAEERSNCRQ